MTFTSQQHDLHSNAKRLKSNKKTPTIISICNLKQKTSAHKTRARCKKQYFLVAKYFTPEFEPRDNNDSNQRDLPQQVAPQKSAAETSHIPARIEDLPD